MAVLSLVTGVNNKILRTPSIAVKKTDRKIKKLVADMVETMKHADGLGLAAPQIGVNLRIYIARLNFNTPNELIVPMINPEILSMFGEIEGGEEGCLSIPQKFGMVRRAKFLTIRYTDQRGKSQTLNLSGLNAKIVQHEMDHLNGTLIADKMEKEVELKSEIRNKSK